MADPKSQQIGADDDRDRSRSTEFDSLLQKEFKPKTDEAKEAVERAVRTLAEQALAETHADRHRRRRSRSRRSSRSSTRS